MNTDTIQVTQELLALLSEIDEFKGAWRALGTIAPERLNALRRVATIESIGSSTRIEGSKLTDREVERLLGNLEIKRFATRDEQEVAGYAEVMETVFQAWSDIPITENHIKQLHRDLLRYSRTRMNGTAASTRTLRNDVGAFDADGKMIEHCVRDGNAVRYAAAHGGLVAWLNEARELQPPASAPDRRRIYRHFPGNSPLSGRQRPPEPRSDHALCCCRAGYAYVPFQSLESVIEHSKEGYYLALRQTQTTIRTDTPNWQPWLLFFSAHCSSRKRRLAVKVEREKSALSRRCRIWPSKILDYCRIRAA